MYDGKGIQPIKISALELLRMAVNLEWVRYSQTYHVRMLRVRMTGDGE